MVFWLRRSGNLEKVWMDSTFREDAATTAREVPRAFAEGEMNENQTRNDTLEEVAQEFDKMKAFGDTAQSFSTFVRDMKVCPPCYGNCNQGRSCPARTHN